ncbi:MAG: hypothetical protein EAZ42_08080 [Verrucomicrobia bacterium]|nr:MAG: hypothetical protein EAZ42_08080 [Verrucomicrobiota bacterium]
MTRKSLAWSVLNYLQKWRADELADLPEISISNILPEGDFSIPFLRCQCCESFTRGLFWVHRRQQKLNS